MMTLDELWAAEAAHRRYKASRCNAAPRRATLRQVIVRAMLALAIVAVVGSGALGVFLYGVSQREAAAHAAYEARLPEIKAKCEKTWPAWNTYPKSGPTSLFALRDWCERHPD